MGKRNVIDRIQLIFKISIPLIIQGLVFQLQSLTDKAFLGNLDTKYVSAIGAGGMPFFACMDSFAAISTGLVILVSMNYGGKKYGEIESFVKSTAFYNSLIGIVLFGMWQIGVNPILAFFKVEEEIIGYSSIYIKICAVYFLLAGIDGTYQAMLQGMGRTKVIMYAGIIKVFVNIVLSWILIFGKLGFPALHVVGAAIGSLIANLISCGFVVIYTLHEYGKTYHLKTFDKSMFSRSPYMKIIKLGLPVCIEYLLWHVTNLLLIRFINGFGYMNMAIYTLTFGFQCIIFVTISGISKGLMTIMGQQKGAGNEREAGRVFYTGLGINFVIVIMGAIVFLIMPETMLRIFSNDSEVIRRGAPYLIGIGFITIPQSLNVACGAAIRSQGNTRWMLLTQVAGSTIIVSLSFLLIEVFHIDMAGIYITIFIDESVRGIMNLLYYRRHYSKKE